MFKHLKADEVEKMPLHLQVMFLLKLWSNGQDEAVLDRDQATA